MESKNNKQFNVEHNLSNLKTLICKTEAAVDSGLGSAMHSKIGKTTINEYSVF